MAMYLKGIVIFCLAIVPVSLCYDDIDSFMTGRQIREVFETEAGSVPIHELVEINLPKRDKRGFATAGTHFTIRAFGEEIPLWLRPTEKILFGENTPIYWADYETGHVRNIKFTYEPTAMPGLVQLLENDEYLASLIIGTEDSGRDRVNGHIAKRGLAIKSLPHDVVTEYLRSRRSINDYESSNSTFHVVYKTNENLERTNLISNINQTMLRNRLARSILPIPDVLYPELLVYVDSSMYEAHGSNLVKLLEYLLAFWNGVDLMYRSLENPKIRLHISAIVVARDPRATPHIFESMFEDKTVNVDRAIAGASDTFRYIEGTFPAETFDIAVTLTSIPLDHGVAGGVADLGLVCSKFKFRMRSVALIRDDGIFSGVHRTGHEIGHVLGLIHDKDTATCSNDDGYMMATEQGNKGRSTSFSPCSIVELQNRLENQNYTCLYDEPYRFGKEMPKLMPGRMKNHDVQCQEHGYNEGCKVHFLGIRDICSNLLCASLDGSGGCNQFTAPALPGTSCTNGYQPKFCLHNKCVSL